MKVKEKVKLETKPETKEQALELAKKFGHNMGEFHHRTSEVKLSFCKDCGAGIFIINITCVKREIICGGAICDKCTGEKQIVS